MSTFEDAIKAYERGETNIDRPRVFAQTQEELDEITKPDEQQESPTEEDGVFVLLGNTEYNSNSLLGVFTTEELAKNYVKSLGFLDKDFQQRNLRQRIETFISTFRGFDFSVWYYEDIDVYFFTEEEWDMNFSEYQDAMSQLNQICRDAEFENTGDIELVIRWVPLNKSFR